MALVCAVVGYLLASQLSSVKANSDTAAEASRLETLQEMYNKESDKATGLEQQLQQTQDELRTYRDQQAAGVADGEALKKEVEQLQVQSGLVDVHGPGVTVVLSDSTAANTTGDEADYIIHDNDLLSVVNELRSAGAEAISLNGERLTATSEIRCTGAVVTVNGRREPAPFTIMAIGDKTTLYNALTMRNGVVDVLRQWKIDVQVSANDELLIPKYSGTIDQRFAKPLDPQETQEQGALG